VSKLAHLHFVSNDKAKTRLQQLGENASSIHIIGSPDIDAMLFSTLPSLDEVRSRYQIGFSEYAILIFHPVTNEIEQLSKVVEEIVSAIIESELNYVVIKPNNDLGTNIIQKGLNSLTDPKRFIHIPSMRFEHFLQLLKNSKFIIGNSSAGVREAAYYGVTAINIGSRQLNRNQNDLIINVGYDANEIVTAVKSVPKGSKTPRRDFGDGQSGKKFANILTQAGFWPIEINKIFIDAADFSKEKK
jgi:UDP-N-acetylglucosamine 2-epimerase (hydrolysing)